MVSEVKKLSGSTPLSTAHADITKYLQHLPGSTDVTSSANTINETFLTPVQEFRPTTI